MLAAAWLLVVVVATASGVLSPWRDAARAQGRTPANARSLSPLVAEAVDVGRAAPGGQQRIVVGLALRNSEALEAFLAAIQDPASPSYGQFLSQEEFNALYAPTDADEAAVVSYLEQSGLRVTDRAPNRLVVGARGSVAALERAFGVEIHDVWFQIGRASCRE